MNYLTGEKQDLWLQQAFPYNRSTVVEGDKESRMGSTVDSKRVVRRAGAFCESLILEMECLPHVDSEYLKSESCGGLLCGISSGDWELGCASHV
jgi:hypothetical protein